MDIIKNQEMAMFDTTVIDRGFFIYGKHQSWSAGVNGLVANITATEILVQFLPSIRNVTNHYRIQAEEVVKGEWEIRISADLVEVESNGITGVNLESSDCR